MSTTGDAVYAIAKLAQDAQVATERVTQVGGRNYSTTKLIEIRDTLPEPAALVIHTLTGFADYLTGNKDNLLLTNLVVHVAGPELVSLRSNLVGGDLQRFEYVRAEVFNRFEAVKEFAFGRWLEPEAMNIALLALFEPTEGREAVMRVLGNITDEAIRTQKDDGVTQEVTVKSGIALVENLRVPNPVELAPLRTFAEVPQPVSPFVFRLRKGPDGVRAALFEADGGAWKLEAIESITEFLAGRLPEVSMIA